MSGRKKDEDNAEIQEKPVERKKFPFQTATRRNNRGKIKLESSENPIDKPSDSKNEINPSKDTLAQILAPVVNEPTKTDDNSPETVNGVPDQSVKDASLKIDPPENIELNTRITQTPENLIKNKVELDVIKVAETTESKKKISRNDLTEKEIDEICRDRDGKRGSYTKTKTPGLDPRFQQQNQTMRCFVMYTDFYRCENILGEGELACQWFKDVFTSICPLDWIRRWDEARAEGRFGWPKGRTQGKFPGNRYGD